MKEPDEITTTNSMKINKLPEIKMAHSSITSKTMYLNLTKNNDSLTVGFY